MKAAVKEPINSTVIGEVEDINLRVDAENFLHIFHILSSSLYTDKIGAVIREIICNARDATNGYSDKPIEISSPTRLNPYFVVRDYGEGLSIEGMKNVFASVGKSTKQDTNEAVGFFGIGSKSPFAYADSYLIESIHNGYLSIYNNIKTSTGPKIQRMGSPIKTDKPSGITVKVPVELMDISEFTNKIADFIKFFDQTTILNGRLIKPNKDSWNQKFKTKDGFILYNGSFGRYNAGILMGGVVYDVDLRKFGFSQSSPNMLLEVPIGALSLPPSRESIEYTKENIKSITNAINEIKESYVSQLDNIKFDDAEEIAKIFNDITSFHNSIGIAANTNIKTPFDVEYFDKVDTGKLDKFGYPIYEQVKKTRKMDIREYMSAISSFRYIAYSPRRSRAKSGITSIDKISDFYNYGSYKQLLQTVYLIDTESNLQKRLKTYFIENPNDSKIICVTKETLDEMDRLKVKRPPNIKNISTLKIDHEAVKRQVVRKKYYYANYGFVLVPVEEQIKDGDTVYVIKCKTKNDPKSVYDKLHRKILENKDHLIFCKHKYVDDVKNDFDKNTVIFIDELQVKLKNMVDTYKISAHYLQDFNKRYKSTEHDYFCFLVSVLGHLPVARAYLKKYSLFYSNLLKFKNSFTKDELKILDKVERLSTYYPCDMMQYMSIPDVNTQLSKILNGFHISDRNIFCTDGPIFNKKKRKIFIDFINAQR